MKATLMMTPCPYFFPLYPTWFRWKECLRFRKADVLALYIPHGSDESLQRRNFRLWPLCYFISHMVQMKVQRTRAGRWPHLPLYPTWFRWKHHRYKLQGWCNGLYIPHGSDERGLSLAANALSTYFISHMVQMKVYRCNQTPARGNALYPTWFRWKYGIYDKPIG